MLADIGHGMGVAARGAVKGLGDLASVVLTGVGPVTSYGQNRDIMDRLTAPLANRLPAPTSGGERLVEAGARGATSTGGLGGPMGVLSGATGAMSADAAAQAGAGTLGQIGAGLVGGLAPAGIARVASGFTTPARAASIIRKTQMADDLTPSVMDQPSPRVGEALAVRVAGQGGEPANRLGEQARGTLAAYTAKRQATVDATRQGMAEARATGQASERAMTDAMARLRMEGQDEVARLREVERLTRLGRQSQAEQQVAEALRGATGDHVADALTRTAALPKQTIQQMLTSAEQDLSRFGREAFGAMDDIEVVPGPEGQAIFETLNDPQVGGMVREAYNTYAPRVEHAPRFQELQKAYQLLGARSRAAARNGGALPNGDLMTDLYTARDALGAAMEQAFPAFRQANAGYRARATVVDALHEGPLLAAKGKAADIVDRMAALEQSGGPEAVAALRQSMARSWVDRLRETPITKDMASRIAAGGSDEMARLRLMFPDEASYQQFASEVADRTGQVAAAHQRGMAGVQAVAPEFAERRMSVRGAVRSEVGRMAKDVRTQRDATARTVRGIQQQGRESLRALQSEDVRTAKAVERASRRLDVPNAGRPLKGAVELGAGARARGIIDVVYGLFGKQSDPKDVRALLADYLLAPPEQRARLAASLRDTQRSQRLALPTGAAMGVYGSQAGGTP